MSERMISFDILKNVGIINELPSGWTKELNVISWNDKEPKFDIRDWSPDHERMSRGLTFTKEEARKLAELILADLD